jgi:chorismate dehydratase
LPFVFALWIIRKEVAEAKFDALVLISRQLREAKQIALSSLEELAEECSERAWMNLEELVFYWRTISYDLSSRQLSGVKAFYRDALEVGILEKEPEITFFSESREKFCP